MADRIGIRAGLAVAIACVVGLASSVRAGEALAWHLKTGDQFYVEWSFLTIEQTRIGFQVQQRMHELDVVARCRVEKSDSDGTQMEMRFERVKTRALGQAGESAQDRLQGSKLHVTFSKEMKLAGIEGLDDLTSTVQEEDSRPAPRISTEGFRHLVANWINHLLLSLPYRSPSDTAGWTTKLKPSPSPAFDHNWTVTPSGHETANGHDIRSFSIKSKRTPIAGAAERGPIESVQVARDEYDGQLAFDATEGRLDHYKFFDRMEIKGIPRLPTPGPKSIWSSMRTAGTVRVTAKNPVLSTSLPAVETASRVMSATPAASSEWTNSVGIKMVSIPAGKFSMATSSEESHEVELTRPFAIGAFEVTIGQYRSFVAATGYKTQAERSALGSFGWNKQLGKIEMSPFYTWENPGWDHDDRHPVVNLSWEDARVFCDWLSRKEHKNYRLPTEAEWEYAARSGTKTMWYWGDEPETLGKSANMADASAAKLFPKWETHAGDDGFVFTAPVGSFKPNAFGLYDMIGNAREWCEDWMWSYPTHAVRDPVGPPMGLEKVQRGGSFADSVEHATCGARIGFPPDTFFVGTGLRVVLTDQPVAPYTPEPSWTGQLILPRDGEGLHTFGFKGQSSRPLLSPVLLVHEDRLDLVRLQLGTGQGLGVKDDFVLLSDAEAFFTTAIAVKPTAESYYLRAAARNRRGDYDGALKDIDEAIKLDARNASLLMERAGIQEVRKDFRAAVGDYNEVVKLQNKNPYAHASLACFLATCPDAKIRDAKKALEHAHKAEELVPRRDGTILDSLAVASAAAAKYDDAVHWEEEALKDSAYRHTVENLARVRLEEYRQKKAAAHGSTAGTNY